MKKIKIVNTSKFALVDDAVYDKYNKYTWRLHQAGSNEYVYAINSKGVRFYLHRVILGIKKLDRSLVIFKDGNHFNFQRSNLKKGDIRNKIALNNSTGYRGVCKRETTKKYKKANGEIKIYKKEYYVAQIGHNKKVKCIGYFNDPVNAAIAYNAEAKRLFGEKAFQNKIPGRKH